MNTVGKNIKSLRYDLNQIPSDFTVEATNTFKELNMIECLKTYLWRKW